MKQKTSLQRAVYLFSTQLMSGSASGGSGIPVYPKKIRQNTQKIPQIHPNIPRYIFRYTLYLKFKESDIPNTRI